MDRKFLDVFSGKGFPVPPVWLMRQAGRYLPEYREVREKAGDFLSLVYSPDLAAEVALQPVRRYGFDAAILFSDILVVPHALGQGLRFEEGAGPVLDPLFDFSFLGEGDFHERLLPVYEAVRLTRSALVREGFSGTALIGFSGSPWTVACYMVQGRGGTDFEKVRLMALQEPEKFSVLIDLLTERTSEYLLRQVQSGAEALQIFDTWAGLLPPDQFVRWVIRPTAKIVQRIREGYPKIPIIGFPKGAGLMVGEYAERTDVSGVGIDQFFPLEKGSGLVPDRFVLQGNLDPLALLVGGDEMDRQVDRILEHGKRRGRFVFNLGHGIHKDTPLQNVARLLERVKGMAG